MGFSRCKVHQGEEVAHCVAHPLCSVAEQLLLYLGALSFLLMKFWMRPVSLLAFSNFTPLKKDVSFCLKHAYFKDMHSFSVN